MKLKLVFEKRELVPPVHRVLSPVLAVALSLALGAVFLKASGFSPLAVYSSMW